MSARKFTAAFLCACLLCPPPGIYSRTAAADEPQTAEDLQKGLSPKKITAKQVLDYLEAHGAFNGPDDARREYFGNDKFLTPLGASMYRYLKSRPNPKEAARELKESFKALSKAGPFTKKKYGVFEEKFKRYTEKFSGLPETGDAEDVFRAGVLSQTFMTGAEAIDAPKQKTTQVESSDGSGHQEIWDEKGRLATYDRDGVLLFNREIQEKQHELNKSRPPQAPIIPETGLYNQEMFRSKYWRLKTEHEQLDRQIRLDRMINLGELLGVQLKDQNWFDRSDPTKINAALEKDLEARGRLKTYEHRGQKYSAWDIAERKTRVRFGYLEKVGEGLAYYDKLVDAYKNGRQPGKEFLDTLDHAEKYVMRYVQLSFLEGLRYAVRGQLERLDPDSSDSQMLQEALKGAPLEDSVKEGYRSEGAKLRARSKRLMAIFKVTEDMLFKSDYAASLDLAQAALNAAQKDYGDISSDAGLYAGAPTLLTALKGQTGKLSFNGSWKPWRWSVGWGRKVVANVSSLWGSGHSARMGEVDKSCAAYQDIASSVAQGDYNGARQAVIALNPDAVYDNVSFSLTGEPAKINESAKVSASLDRTRDIVARVMAVNRWVNTAASLVTWSVGIGLLARPMRVMASSIEVLSEKGAEICGQIAGRSRLAFGFRLLGGGLRLISAAAEQTRFQLDSLEPGLEHFSPAVLESPLRLRMSVAWSRTVSVGERQAYFMGMAGLLSGGYMVVSDLISRIPRIWGVYPSDYIGIGHDPSNFKLWRHVLPVDAFWQGFEGGVEWAGQSFHPALNYIGIPSTLYEGTRFAAATEVLGSKGLFGSIWNGLKAFKDRINGTPLNVITKRNEEISRTLLVKERNRLQALVRGRSELRNARQAADTMWSKFGVGARQFGFEGFTHLRRMPMFAGSMADNLLKFTAFGVVTGKAVEIVNWRWNQDEPGVGDDEDLRDVLGLERRIKRAKKIGTWMQWAPFWLFLPTYPAKYMKQAQSSQRSLMGIVEYENRKGGLAELINGGTEKDFTFSNVEMTPFWLRGSYYTRRAPVSENTFRVSSQDMPGLIRKYLIERASGGKREADLAKLNPKQFLDVSISDPHDMPAVGDVRNTDEVRIEARKLCVETLAERPDLVEKIFSQETGGTLKDFGEIMPETRKAVASMINDELPKGSRIKPDSLKQAREILSRWINQDNLADDGKEGAVFREKIAAIKGSGEGFEKSRAGYKGLFEEQLGELSRWAKLPKQMQKPYIELVKKFREKAKTLHDEEALGEQHHEALEAFYNLIEAQHRQFGSFNNVGTVQALLEEEIGALREKYAGEFAGKPKAPGSGILEILDGWPAKLKDFAKDVPDPGTAPADKKLKPLISEFYADVDQGLKAGKITQEQAKFLRQRIKSEMEGAPWILHDAHGSALPDWKPGQFLSYYHGLSEIAQHGAGGEAIRSFLSLTMGGGKTLLVLVGLLPVVEADARAHGIPVKFFTLQSNLSAQAQLDWRAYRRAGKHALTFGTYEDLKSDIAQTKSRGGRQYAETVWILGDEMDGAALQPALTLGETTGLISLVDPTAVREGELGKRMEEVLTQGFEKLAQEAKGQAQLIRDVTDGAQGGNRPGRGRCDGKAF